MNIAKIHELAEKYHNGQFRKDGKTPYIFHPLKVCDYLYSLGFTNKSLFEELDNHDFTYYAVALMHDLLEDTKVSEQEILDVSNIYVGGCVKKLTYSKNDDNPFSKFNYLKEITECGDLVFIVKCLDRIANVEDFIKEGNLKYAKIYFHKADILWNEVYQKRSVLYNKLWDKIINLYTFFHTNYNKEEK